MNDQTNLQWPKEIQEQDGPVSSSSFPIPNVDILLAIHVQVCNNFILFDLLCASLIGFTKQVGRP